MVENNIDEQIINKNFIHKAYCLLKSDLFYDNVNLFKRYAFAEFEASEDFKEKLDSHIEKIMDLVRDDKSLIPDEWLNEIDVFFLPKGAKNENEGVQNSGTFLTNYRQKDKYEIEKVNYFFNAPIPIYLISMLWVLTIGKLLDEKISDKCLGNRLSGFTSSDIDSIPHNVFKLYFSQYAKWRDDAINIGLNHLKGGKNILLIALDIKEFFYRLPIHWDEIEKTIKFHQNGRSDINEFKRINDLLRTIHKKYSEKIKDYLNISHEILNNINTENKIIGLPIGLPSSNILSNWELKKVDDDIEEKLNPLYSGRYVDDILIVLSVPKKQAYSSTDNQKIIDKYLVGNMDDKILTSKKDTDGNEYYFTVIPELSVQPGKLLIHFYDSNHSYAGLADFKKELEHQASEFRFLPHEEVEEDIASCAYDLHYKGSINKLRSLIGVFENETEIKKYISRRIIEHRLCTRYKKNKKEIVDELFKFFSGKNMFDFCRSWEKVFSFLLIDGKKTKEYHKFYEEVEKTVNNITGKNNNDEKNKLFIKKLIQDTKVYLNYSFSLPLGLVGNDIEKFLENTEYYDRKSELVKKANDFRKSNLIRHQLVAWPLLNYTIYSGNLITFDYSLMKDDIELMKEKVKYSPRYVHFDEFQLFNYLKIIMMKNPVDFARLFYSKSSFLKDYKKVFNGLFKTNQLEKCIIVEERDSKSHVFSNVIRIENIQIENIKTIDEIIIGVANTKVDEQNIKKSYIPGKSPNISYERQAVVFNLLNEAIKEPRCDLIILPELSVPFHWLPLMVNQSRRNNLGMVFGLEHVVVEEFALNMVATILPFQIEGKYNNCFVSLRLKNHYSPKETYELDLYRRHRPELIKPYYERFVWKDLSFTVFNCYELSDISHRGVFRSLVDLLIAVEWNKDINYYSNIVESCTRDLHCFVAQVNTSEFGDSRISTPSKTEKINLVRVKGGLNHVLLKEKLPIKELRAFQLKEYDPLDETYKPTPAGYDRNNVVRRMNNN